LNIHCDILIKNVNIKLVKLLMKKALKQTQTLRAGCSKAERKISPRRRAP